MFTLKIRNAPKFAKVILLIMAKVFRLNLSEIANGDTVISNDLEYEVFG